MRLPPNITVRSANTTICLPLASRARVAPVASRSSSAVVGPITMGFTFSTKCRMVFCSWVPSSRSMATFLLGCESCRPRFGGVSRCSLLGPRPRFGRCSFPYLGSWGRFPSPVPRAS